MKNYHKYFGSLRGILRNGVACIIILIVINKACGADLNQFTIDDLVQGINTRQSRVHDFEIKYDLDVTHTAQYDAKTSVGPVDIKGLAALDEHATRSFLLRGAGDRRYYEVYEGDDSGRSLMFQGAYVGGIIRGFEAGKKTLTINRAAPAEVIFFLTPSDLLAVEDQDIVAYLSNSGITAVVSGVRRVGDDVLIDVVAKRHFIPPFGPGPEVAIDIIHKITFSYAHGFWPLNIEESELITTLKTKEFITDLFSKMQVAGFVTSHGIDYPQRIELTTYSRKCKYDNPNNLPRWLSEPLVKTKNVLTVTGFNANDKLADSDFTLPSQGGWTVYDATRNIAFVAGGDVLQIDGVPQRKEDMSTTAFPFAQPMGATKPDGIPEATTVPWIVEWNHISGLVVATLVIMGLTGFAVGLLIFKRKLS